MDSTLKSLLLPQILLTSANVLITGAPLAADLNRTHATNPLWTGHARYHVVWQVLSYANLGILNLYLIWSDPSPTRLAVSCAILSCIIIGFFMTAFNIKRFGGAFYDVNGYLPFARPTIWGKQIELDVNSVGFSIFAAVLAAAAVSLWNLG